jgi:hypothetical protein
VRRCSSDIDADEAVSNFYASMLYLAGRTSAMTQPFSSSFTTAMTEAWAALVNSCRAMIAHRQYHPELYYMRGPGPKWREKNSRG